MPRHRSFCERGCGRVATRTLHVTFDDGSADWGIRSCDRCNDDVAFLSLLEPGAASVHSFPDNGLPPESAKRQIAAVDR